MEGADSLKLLSLIEGGQFQGNKGEGRHPRSHLLQFVSPQEMGRPRRKGIRDEDCLESLSICPRRDPGPEEALNECINCH